MNDARKPVKLTEGESALLALFEQIECKLEIPELQKVLSDQVRRGEGFKGFEQFQEFSAKFGTFESLSRWIKIAVSLENHKLAIVMAARVAMKITAIDHTSVDAKFLADKFPIRVEYLSAAEKKMREFTPA